MTSFYSKQYFSFFLSFLFLSLSLSSLCPSPSFYISLSLLSPLISPSLFSLSFHCSVFHSLDIFQVPVPHIESGDLNAAILKRLNYNFFFYQHSKTFFLRSKIEVRISVRSENRKKPVLLKKFFFGPRIKMKYD